MAQDPFQPSGTSLTRGSVVSPNDLNSSTHNPAAPSYLLKGQSGFQSNFISPFGLAYEVGKVDSVINELDDLINILEDENLSAEEALNAKDRFDPFLQSAAQDGMIKVGGNLALPFTPLLYQSNEYGTFSADLQFYGSLRSTVIDDKIAIININDTYKINTSAALYVKSAGAISLGLGYSRPVWNYNESLLHAGIKINVNQYKLAKNLISLAGLEDGENVADAIENDYENNANSSTNIGVDAGLIWASKFFTAGLSIVDINEPEYEYGELGVATSDCQDLSGLSLENCFVAQQAIAQGRLSAGETFIANAQANFSAATWFGEGIRWGFHTSIDLNDKNDAIGDAYQWANVGATTQFNNWLVPELRLGYTKNLSGTQLSYYSVGVTFFKQAELDVRWSDETVEIDDSNAPRSAYFSFAIQTQF